MQAAIQTSPVSKTALWAGRVMSALPILFLIFDGVTHLMQIAPVMDAFRQLGYPTSLAVEIGLIELVCVIVYLIPSTSVLGAILLTGYLGGAIVPHVRIGDSLFTQIFPIILGLLLWGGLYLRNDRLRALIPLRK